MATNGAGTMKSSFTSILPVLRPPRIRRRHLRKYSWLPDVLRLKGSIISRIIGPVLTITLFSIGVAYAKENGLQVVQTSSIVPLLSVVVGLLLVFRNGTSYDRFWEGRKTFASMTSNIRSLSRQIWISVALPPITEQPEHAKGKTPVTSLTAAHLHHRKVEALRLCLSFAFATKHYLRGEDGIHWDDFQGILPAAFVHFGERGFNVQITAETRAYSTMSNDSNERGSGTSTPDGTRPDATKRVRAKRSKQQIASPTTPLLSGNHHTIDFHTPPVDTTSMPLPMVLAHELSRIIFSFRKDGCLETVGPAGVNAMFQSVTSMVDQLTSMERVANTPIPSSYGIHLKQCVTLYLFALPFSLVTDLGWAMVPIVTIVAFTFMGIEGIAEEIEMPFGNDGHDLPLDRYCQDLKDEISYMIERLPEGGEGLHGYDDGEGDD